LVTNPSPSWKALYLTSWIQSTSNVSAMWFSIFTLCVGWVLRSPLSKFSLHFDPTLGYSQIKEFFSYNLPYA
jgi:hypothetical protein